MAEEKRKYLRLRKAVNEAPAAPKLALILMAKLLPPQELARVDAELGKHYDWEIAMRLSASRRRLPVSEIETIVKRVGTPAEFLPNEILQKPLADFGVPKQALEPLRFSMITSVGDFVLRDREQLKSVGIRPAVVEQTEAKLLEFGIRHKDNPPIHLRELITS